MAAAYVRELDRMLTNENRRTAHKMNSQIKLLAAFLRQGGGFCGQPVEPSFAAGHSKELLGRSAHEFFGFPSLTDLPFCNRIRLRDLDLNISTL
jgi:hypothetical protein